METLQWLAGSRQPTLCVWGAGPCNDLDLAALLKCYSQVTLVDLDTTTLQQAVKLRSLETASNLHVLGDIDLAGISFWLEQWPNRSNGKQNSQFRKLLDFARTYTPERLGRFDVVASTCLLSQILEAAVAVFSDEPQRMLDLSTTLRRRHLELLVQHTLPGGRAVLLTDVTSSAGLPELNEPDADAQNLFRRKVLAGNHFHGLDPRVISAEIEQSDLLRQRVKKHFVSPPWIWDATERKYLCLAFMLYV